MAQTTPPRPPGAQPQTLDALVIGAGFAGLYQLYRMREMGLKVRAFDTASGVGGTWYWNRYPGARYDSTVEVYQYWISKDLYQSWQPSERFPGQPENERWLNYIADQLDLKRDIEFNTRIESAHWREADGRWEVITADGRHIDTQYLLSCCGMLSAPLHDLFPGQSSFKGRLAHTGLWPKEGIDLKNKRVAVIGTGATGIQVIQTIAEEVDSLTVFARTPQYVVPMKNPRYTAEDWEQWSNRFDETKYKVRNTFAGMDYDFGNAPWAELSADERTAILEKYWAEGSLAMWLATFPEMFFDADINEAISEFVREKMRKRLRYDPKLCDLLIPSSSDYGFGTRRVPLENGYLEAYLRDNVHPVDCRKTPVECIVPEGVKTSDGKVHEVDVIILATGFDGGTGALTRMDIYGRDGRLLRDEWNQDVRTALGLQVHGYPNLFTAGAPLSPAAALCNVPTCLQQQVEWISACIQHARNSGKQVIEATRELQDEWVRHHDETANATLVANTRSWYTGSNVEGKTRRLISYIGGVNQYHQRCDELAAAGYPGFAMR